MTSEQRLNLIKAIAARRAMSEFDKAQMKLRQDRASEKRKKEVVRNGKTSQ